MASYIIGGVILAIVVAIVVKLVHDKRKGKSSCGCGCEGCGSASDCRVEAGGKEN